jgi:hypothetical protein
MTTIPAIASTPRNFPAFKIQLAPPSVYNPTVVSTVGDPRLTFEKNLPSPKEPRFLTLRTVHHVDTLSHPADRSENREPRTENRDPRTESRDAVSSVL